MAKRLTKEGRCSFRENGIAKMDLGDFLQFMTPTTLKAMLADVAHYKDDNPDWTIARDAIINHVQTLSQVKQNEFSFAVPPAQACSLEYIGQLGSSPFWYIWRCHTHPHNFYAPTNRIKICDKAE